MWVEEHLLPTWGLVGVSLDNAVAMIEAPLGARFGPASDFDHGYPIRRAQLAKMNWVWLSPNRVPRGFARKRSRVAHGVPERFQGEALRHPDHAGATTILSCAYADAGRAEQALRQAGIQRLQIAAGRRFD